MEVASDHIIQEFKKYQTNRERCLQHTIDYLPGMNNVESIDKAGMVELFRAILLDPIQALHETAVVGLARFASINEEFALYLISVNIIQQLIDVMRGRHHRFQSAVLYVIRSASKHSSISAQGVVDAGGLKCIVTSLLDLDPRIIQSAARAVINIGMHSVDLTEQVLEAGCMQHLVNGIRHGYIPVKLYCATALAEMSLYSITITDILLGTNFACVVKCIELEHLPHKILALTTLVSLCKYHKRLVDQIICLNFIPYVIHMTCFPNDTVRTNAARVIEEVTKFTEDLCLYVANSGGMMVLLQMGVMNPSNITMSSVIALGNMAASSADLAMRLIRTNGMLHLTHLFACESDPNMHLYIVYAMCETAKHSPEHAKTLLNPNTFEVLLQKSEDASGDPELRKKCHDMLKHAILKCVDIQVLIPLLQNVPESIFRYVLRQIILIITNDPCAKRTFAKTDALKIIQEFQAKPNSKVDENRDILYNLFPEEILNHYNDDDFDQFIGEKEEYIPEVTPILFQIKSKDEDNHEDEQTEDENKEKEGYNTEEVLVEGGSLYDNIAS